LDTLSLEVRLSKEQANRVEKEQTIAITQSLLEGQEQERKRLSAELHDSIGGLLSQLRYLLGAKTTQHNQILTTILDELFDEVRGIGTDLYSPHLQKFSLVQLVEGYCQKYKKNNTIKIQVEYSGQPFAKSEQVKLHLFRIVQEAVTNAIRHSKATQILVQLIYTEAALSIIIEDNGVGLPHHDTPKGMGIDNMRNRATFIRAELSIDSLTPQGTCVQLHWGYDKIGSYAAN
jgi:signal transduction histidine kinase